MSEELLSAVVQRLAAEIPEFRVEDYPSNTARFNWGGAGQHLLVAPEGSTFGADPASLDPLSIDDVTRVSVTVLVRSLRGELGAVTTLARVRRALFGWWPALRLSPPGTEPAVVQLLGFGPMTPERSGFVGEQHGIWRWVIAFKTTTVAVAESAELSGPPLKSVEIKDA